MHPMIGSTWRMLANLAVACAMVAALVVQGVSAEEGPSAAPPVLGCSWAPPKSAAAASVLSAEADDDGDADDESNGDEDEADEPRIVGSLVAPPNTRRNDQRALAAVAKISRDEAIKIALGALPDAERRRVEDVELEIEQGYVIWEVETVLRSREHNPDRFAEVVIDAGNGKILFIECEAEDD